MKQYFRYFIVRYFTVFHFAFFLVVLNAFSFHRFIPENLVIMSINVFSLRDLSEF